MGRGLVKVAGKEKERGTTPVLVAAGSVLDRLVWDLGR
jgi:hypothetical protein